MRNGWQINRLDDVCNVEYGTRVVQKRDGGSIYSVYGGGGPTFHMDDFNREDRLVIARFAMSKQCTRFIKGKFFLNDSGLTVSPKNGAIIPRFLEYQMLALNDEIYSLARGTAQKNLDVPSFRGIQIAVPSEIKEQQRIVSILDNTFANIATAKVNAEKNFQNARALFESHLQSVFTQRGPGWVETTIGETCTLRSGTTVSPTLEHPIGDIPYLKVADMAFKGNEHQVTTSSRFLRKADVKESAIIPKGSTIFPKRGGAILTNKKRITSLSICADLNIMAVIPSSQIDAGLLYFYFLNVDMRKLGTGSSIPQINNYDVSPLLISFPKSLITQEKIVSKLDDLREETQRLAIIYQRKLAALEELKKSVLHQAFCGNLEAKAA